MGKNKRKQIICKSSFGVFSVDSNEESAFIHWCDDALTYQLISINLQNFYQPESFLLIPEVKINIGKKEKTLLRSHIYTCDFIIKINPESFLLFPKLSKLFFKSFDDNYYIDIKGSFNKNGGDRSFSINQKLLYNKFKIYVNKIVPDKLFNFSFLPKNEKFSPKKHILREKFKNLKTLDEIKLATCLKTSS